MDIWWTHQEQSPMLMFYWKRCYELLCGLLLLMIWLWRLQTSKMPISNLWWLKKLLNSWAWICCWCRYDSSNSPFLSGLQSADAAFFIFLVIAWGIWDICLAWMTQFMDEANKVAKWWAGMFYLHPLLCWWCACHSTWCRGGIEEGCQMFLFEVRFPWQLQRSKRCNWAKEY